MLLIKTNTKKIKFKINAILFFHGFLFTITFKKDLFIIFLIEHFFLIAVYQTVDNEVK